MNPTKTTNRLHFEDLDPFRFEDLGRELLDLMYSWKRLDPIGGEGSDDGVDIFGVTTDGIPCYCQVKRYKVLIPSKIESIIEAIAENNELEENACIILIVSCNLSKKGFDAFYAKSEELGFSNQIILTAKTIETALYNKYPLLLEKYFGIKQSRSTGLTGRNLIQRTEKGKKLVDKFLLDPEVSYIQRLRNPATIFIDSELILLSHDANKLKHRYEDPDLYNKVFPFQLHDGGIDCIVMAYCDIVYNHQNKTWRLKNKSEQLLEEEELLPCQVVEFLPFYNIVSIEDWDEYFSCHIIHCDISPIWKVYSKTTYRYNTCDGYVIFDKENPLTENDYEILERDIKKRNDKKSTKA